MCYNKSWKHYAKWDKARQTWKNKYCMIPLGGGGGVKFTETEGGERLPGLGVGSGAPMAHGTVRPPCTFVSLSVRGGMWAS